MIETHFHADFVSGHLELAARTGASICYGDGGRRPTSRSSTLADGERVALGDVELEVRATPGHTPESISLVVYEHAGDEVPYGVLTGDTLFIGDVGRPDLLAAIGRHGRRHGPVALPVVARQAHAPARRHPGLPRPRRRLGLRQAPLDGDRVDHRRAAPDQLRPRSR